MERMPIRRDTRQKVVKSPESQVSPEHFPMMKAEQDDKLEFKWEEAWFSVDVELKNDVITVRFEGFEDVETWSIEAMQSKKPLCQQIRIVSEQLQDEDCNSVKVNQTVCALSPIRTQGWYDATIVEVTVRRHLFELANETCTCSFAVVWLDGPHKGQREDNLQCGNICLHSKKDVNTHPLIKEILQRPTEMSFVSFEDTEDTNGGNQMEVMSSSSDLDRHAAHDQGERVLNSDPRHDGESARVFLNSECVLTIDNLELDIQPVDVIDLLTKFDAQEKIQSVHIPLPHPEMIHALSYVVFVDRKAANVTLAHFNQNIVVSTRGRPWIVNQAMRDLNKFNFNRTLNFLYQCKAFKEREAQESDLDPRRRLKIIRSTQEVEYQAAKRRQELFEDHRRQARSMFRRHVAEERAIRAQDCFSNVTRLID